MDGRGLQWRPLEGGTEDDRAVVEDCVRAGIVRGREALFDFRIPVSNTRRGQNYEPPALGEVLELYDDGVLVLTAVVRATRFDPRGRGLRSRAVGRALLGRVQYRI